MELREAQHPDSPPSADDFGRALVHQHQRVREFLAAQRSRVARIEADLAERIKRFHVELEARETRNAALENRNAELEKKLAARPAAPPTASPGASLSWEAKKRQFLAALEAEGEPDTAPRRQERVEIQDIIRKTDKAMAEKDCELAEIRRVLEQQSSTLGGMAVGAVALGEVLDQDAIIREERENLKRMKAHWEEMLRQAEIDLSLDRAKLARDRSELEEKLRALQAAESAQASRNATGPQPPVRGRWLARLGIKSQE